MLWIKFVKIAEKKYVTTLGAGAGAVLKKVNLTPCMERLMNSHINTKGVTYTRLLGTSLSCKMARRCTSIARLWKNILAGNYAGMKLYTTLTTTKQTTELKTLEYSVKLNTYDYTNLDSVSEVY